MMMAWVAPDWVGWGVLGAIAVSWLCWYVPTVFREGGEARRRWREAEELRARNLEAASGVGPPLTAVEREVNRQEFVRGIHGVRDPLGVTGKTVLVVIAVAVGGGLVWVQTNVKALEGLMNLVIFAGVAFFVGAIVMHGARR